MRTFLNFASVKYQGVVVVFGLAEDMVLYFNVLRQNTESDDENLDWSGFRPVQFPAQVRQVGMNLISMPFDVGVPAPMPVAFRVVTDQKFICVVQVSAAGTLYLSRFRLLSGQSTADPQVITYRLEPAWEVRYAVSRKSDIPADKTDYPDYLGKNTEPFIEPMLELSMIDARGGFDVVLLPVSGSAQFAWQFITVGENAQVNFYNFPATENGLFDVSTVQIGADYRMVPHSTFTLIDSNAQPLAIGAFPKAVTYVKHEQVVSPEGSSMNVRRASRVMIAIPVGESERTGTVLIDSAVSSTGTLAQLRGEVVASDIVPAAFELYFNGMAHLHLRSLGSSALNIAGPFTLHFLLAPGKGMVANQLIGGASATARNAAPFVFIDAGGYLRVGFGNGTVLVTCTTLHQVLFERTWADVVVSYTAPGENPLQVSVNGAQVPLTPCASATPPAGQPIERVGRAREGFIGSLKSLEIRVGNTLVVNLKCETIDYTITPPSTPNSAGSGVFADVYGATLRSSTSPVDSNMSGEFYLDPHGLTYYVGLADFIKPLFTLSIIEASDGLLHCYYLEPLTQPSRRMLVAQCSTESARTTFTVDWTTNWSSALEVDREHDGGFTPARFRGWATDQWTPIAPRLLVAPDTTQSGFLNFVAHRVGTYMNAARISIEPSSVSPLLCDVHVQLPSTMGRETWRGLPRELLSLSRIWNGGGTNVPDDARAKGEAKPYFDYTGTVPSVLVPAGPGSEGGFFRFCSVPGSSLPLVSVLVEPGSTPEFVNIHIETAAPPLWPAGTLLQQHWPEVPNNVQLLLKVFGGASQRYAYDRVTTPGARVYGVPLSEGLEDHNVDHVKVYVRDVQPDFTLVISDASDPRLCDVQVCGEHLVDVPRAQKGFVSTLNGANTDYAYPPGYLTGLATRIYALGNGLEAQVGNYAGTVVEARALGFSGLLRVLYQGKQSSGVTLAVQVRTAAAVIQSARRTLEGEDSVIHGSTTFAATPATLPSDGRTGRISNTSTHAGGYAPTLIPGINGGWLPEVPRFSLEFSAAASHAVTFDINRNFAPAQRLAISSDLAVQAWIRPDVGSASSRVLTYNINGNAAQSRLPVQYMMGLTRKPALRLIAASEFQFPMITLRATAMTVQFHVYMTSLQNSRIVSFCANNLTVVLSNSTLTVIHGTAEHPWREAARLEQWYCVTVVIEPVLGVLKFFVDDAEPLIASIPSQAPVYVGPISLGRDYRGCVQGKLNGLAIWLYALSNDDVKRTFRVGVDGDETLELLWMMTEAEHNGFKNSAPTGAKYDATGGQHMTRDPVGLFAFPYIGRNSLIMTLPRPVKDWTHVGMSSRQGYGLDLEDEHYGKVEDGARFVPVGNFALEAWIDLRPVSGRCVIVHKPGSYLLSVDDKGELELEVYVEMENEQSPPVPFTHRVKYLIPQGSALHIAANVQLGQRQSRDPEAPDIRYFVDAQLFVNGAKVATQNDATKTSPVSIRQQTSPLYVGCADGSRDYFQGRLSHVRLWGRLLTPLEILETYQFRSLADQGGLIAGWQFEELDGAVAKDITDTHPLHLTSSQLWTIWQEVAQLSGTVNGRSVPRERLWLEDVGGYGMQQFTLGALRSADAVTLPFAGRVGDVRLFNTFQTPNQVSESLYAPLRGREEGLAAYWDFQSGSGAALFDMTGHGNVGTLSPSATPPKWVGHAAPVRNEAPLVVNALGGEPDSRSASARYNASVVEYATTDVDAYGVRYSVMKRGYFYVDAAGRTRLQLGYKIGDLDTIYVGQVQSKPTVIGFIEGGPPIPSENQTLTYWVGDGGGPARLYDGVSKVSYTELDTLQRTVGGNQSSMVQGDVKANGGFKLVDATDVFVGLGAGASKAVNKGEFNFGLKLQTLFSTGSGEGVEQAHSATTTFETGMTPPGHWEPEDAILNSSVGRRYSPNNVGVALVKSAVADLYMVALKGTLIPVSYVVVPNTDIPIDTNLISFPINPRYVKNGTLDGKVGLMNDLHYPDANQTRGSYFKPVEAYRLKQRIDDEEQDLEAFHAQLKIGKAHIGHYKIQQIDKLKRDLALNPAYEFGRKVNHRSLYNTYVWNADGGIRKQELSVTNSYSENYSSSGMLYFGLGATAKAELATPFGGYFAEADVLFGNEWKITTTKGSTTTRGFTLTCTVDPTNFLSAPRMSLGDDGRLKFDGYKPGAAPGKVDGYRYMSFLLAPHADNFAALSEVIEPNWLNNSMTAAATAMREALSTPSQPWRVLYRTTYVSRVPEPFQPVKEDTLALDIRIPANLKANRWLMRLIESQFDTPSPTPLEVGQALDTVLGRADFSAPGLLEGLIPWWSLFYEAAAEFGSPAFLALAELRTDLLGYVLDKVEADNFRP